MRRYVIYTRVSTDDQGKSGLGIAAQVRDIELFLQNYSDVPWEVVRRYTEVASGGDDSRPMLAKAIKEAKQHKAELLVAKLDRLGRKVSTLAALMDDKALQIRVASMPHADKFQLHIYAALAEQERDFISTRTKAALAAAKARGRKLGGDRGGLARANIVKQASAQAFAERVAPIIRRLMAGGANLAEVATMLNEQQVAGANGEGGTWTGTAVRRVLARVAPDGCGASA